MVRQMKRTTKSINQDRRKKSSQRWETGRGAKRKGNPRFRPKIIKGIKRYVLRKR